MNMVCVGENECSTCVEMYFGCLSIQVGRNKLDLQFSMRSIILKVQIQSASAHSAGPGFYIRRFVGLWVRSFGGVRRNSAWKNENGANKGSERNQNGAEIPKNGANTNLKRTIISKKRPQSINQSIHRAIHPSIHQSSIPSIHHSSINQSIDQSIHQPTDQSTPQHRAGGMRQAIKSAAPDPRGTCVLDH